jgi:hypothetical protein
MNHSRSVPAYAPNGRRLREYSLEAVDRLLALTPPRVTAKRHRRTGRVTSIQFLPQKTAALEGNETLPKSVHLGQHYSYEQTVDDAGHRVWAFTRLLAPRDTDVDVEEYLQAVFRAVPLSCLRRR